MFPWSFPQPESYTFFIRTHQTSNVSSSREGISRSFSWKILKDIKVNLEQVLSAEKWVLKLETRASRLEWRRIVHFIAGFWDFWHDVIFFSSPLPKLPVDETDVKKRNNNVSFESNSWWMSEKEKRKRKKCVLRRWRLMGWCKRIEKEIHVEILWLARNVVMNCKSFSIARTRQYLHIKKRRRWSESSLPSVAVKLEKNCERKKIVKKFQVKNAKFTRNSAPW